MSFSYLTLVIQLIQTLLLLSNHLHELLLDLFFYDYMSCLTCQPMSLYNRFQEVYAKLTCHKTNWKRVI